MQETSEGQVSRNIRFLLWREGVPATEWRSALRRRLPYTWDGREEDEGLRRLLSGGPLEPAEVSELAGTFHLSEEELRYSDLVADAGVDVVCENLRYLIGSLERGGKRELARGLGVDPTTISRWLAGSSRPRGLTLQKVPQYFGLPPSTDLAADTVFLSPDPVSAVDKKQWLRDRIDSLSSEELRDFYPALERLLD